MTKKEKRKKEKKGWVWEGYSFSQHGTETMTKRSEARFAIWIKF